MTSITGTASLGLGLSPSKIGSSSKTKTSLEDIFAAQEAKEAQKAEEGKAAVADFIKFAKMSPAERIRAAFLKDHNLTEESLSKLSPTEREKIEEEIKKLVKTKLGLDDANGTGQLVDVSV